MPTRHRRIGVVCDAELAEALLRAGSQLDAVSEAARVRELALIGARSINEDFRIIDAAGIGLSELGATAPGGDLLKISRKLRQSAGETDETASESLQWARGPR